MNATNAGRILELVHKISGLHFSDKKMVFFERRLRERIIVLGLEGVEDYSGYLKNEPDELGELVQTLTTNKTFFMRNPAQFLALKEAVLPGLIREKNLDVVSSWGKRDETSAPGGRNPAMKLRLWSAGCSTGEEAYTMAFTLLSVLQYPKAWDVRVIATDLTRRVLEEAERGVYGIEAIRELPEEYRNAYLKPVADGWKVAEAPKGLVGFYESNLMEFMNSPRRMMSLKGLDGNVEELRASEYFDVAFCRNVMIYFDRAGQERLVKSLYDSLRPGGVLFTGDSEPLHLFEHGFKRADDEEALYYIKPA